MERNALSMWWDQATWNLARSAYVAELDEIPSGPDTLLGWIIEAIESHATRSSSVRARMSSTSTGEGAGLQKVHQLPSSVMVAIDDAIVADRQSAGRVVSRSAWVREAVRAAAAETQDRLGSLPEPPARLPTGPARKRH